VADANIAATEARATPLPILTATVRHLAPGAIGGALDFMKRATARRRGGDFPDRDAQRLGELKDFLRVSGNRANLRRILEITEQLQRIQKRLAELENTG
jgi:hypothetical protein